MKLNSISTLIVSICFLASVHAGNEWMEYPGGFEYKSKNLSYKIGNDGTFNNLKDADGILLVKNVYIMGDYVFQGEKHDTRLFQTACKGGPLKVSGGGNIYQIHKEGYIGSKIYEKAVRFSENASISSDKIIMECEVEYLVELSSKRCTPFWTIINIPVETFRNKGYGTKEKNGKSTLSVFPELYSGKATVASRLKELIIVQGNYHLTIRSNDEDTFFLISDPRSYDAKSDVLRIDIGKTLPYINTPRTFAPGAKFKWSFEISFTEIKD
ncbi:MAG: hypothetical protein A2017_15295 [Lentisphaerae bacterium GWF2_44_16]|nr:MAG: hypothetical protein A2017_15295 [Lentisphaerae bacterium GWF2_44_16]